MTLLKQDIKKRKQVNNLLESNQKLDLKENKKSKVEIICNNEIDVKEAVS